LLLKSNGLSASKENSILYLGLIEISFQTGNLWKAGVWKISFINFIVGGLIKWERLQLYNVNYICDHFYNCFYSFIMKVESIMYLTVLDYHLFSWDLLRICTLKQETIFYDFFFFFFAVLGFELRAHVC
jgi:hypothetical protein